MNHKKLGQELGLLYDLYKEVLKAYFQFLHCVMGQLLAASEPLSIRSLTALRRYLDDPDDDSVIAIVRHLGSAKQCHLN